ncbi:unnamed protein product [Protopolystoma xenopodis]|uniref:PI3K/PI4K catalytic domain-containing protein n=1 Tax=Protopolystoma xenopodis TaxID=117903 RepID=A0A3S5CDU8_9PLAT|nr:unnamed protein product [Protopolystoma xenopodis]
MLCRETGKVIHIDFGDCFEVAMLRERFPEKVPFRLTRMIVNAMEVTGIDGVFRYTCELVISLMRSNRESLLAVLEAFIHDPLLQWVLLESKKDFTTSVTPAPAAAAPAAAAAHHPLTNVGAASGTGHHHHSNQHYPRTHNQPQHPPAAGLLPTVNEVAAPGQQHQQTQNSRIALTNDLNGAPLGAGFQRTSAQLAAKRPGAPETRVTHQTQRMPNQAPGRVPVQPVPDGQPASVGPGLTSGGNPPGLGSRLAGVGTIAGGLGGACVRTGTGGGQATEGSGLAGAAAGHNRSTASSHLPARLRTAGVLRVFTDAGHPNSLSLRDPHKINPWRHHLCNGPWLGCYETGEAAVH